MGRLRVRSSSLKAKEMITNQMMKQPIRQAYNSQPNKQKLDLLNHEQNTQHHES
jgi:hypothetical protein